MHRKEGSHELFPVRVITIHRDDLLPYQQDLYDNQGNLETQVYYSSYQSFDFGMYPARLLSSARLKTFNWC